MNKYPEYWPQFYTATIVEWKPLLQNDLYKQIIVESLQYLVQNKRITLYAFVIMNNHIHLIWQVTAGHTPSNIQLSFMRYTSQMIKFNLLSRAPLELAQFKVNKKDNTYRIWKRCPLGIEIFSEAVFLQKLEYIHNNPVRKGLCVFPEEYKYSSASFYLTGIDEFNMLTHC